MMTKKKRKELGNQLSKLREDAGLTQAELAEKAGLSTNYYATVERGEENISYDKLQRIMEALNLENMKITRE